MSVESWDPGASATTLGAAEVQRLLAAAAKLAEKNFGLADEEVAALAPLVCQEAGVDWQAAASPLSGADIELLIRLFTLAESRFAAWESGARSPVIVLARELKRRGEYPDGLNAWIKANSQNRFLPHGSLLDRL